MRKPRTHSSRVFSQALAKRKANTTGGSTKRYASTACQSGSRRLTRSTQRASLSASSILCLPRDGLGAKSIPRLLGFTAAPVCALR